MFGVTAYFCLGPFRQAAGDKDWPKAKRRVKFYTICGYAIIACLVILGIVELTMTVDLKKAWAPIFWGEFVILWIFSAAWMVAAKWIPWFTDPVKDEPLHLPNEFQLGVLNISQYWKK